MQTTEQAHAGKLKQLKQPQEERCCRSLGLGENEVPRDLHPVQSALFILQIQKSPMTEPVVAKIKGLGEY
jgi:hypothetical protein